MRAEGGRQARRQLGRGRGGPPRTGLALAAWLLLGGGGLPGIERPVGHAQSSPLQALVDLMTDKRPVDLASTERRLRRKGLRAPLRSPRLLVEKRLRRMTLFDGEKPVAVHPIGLGREPDGVKQREGDNRTPEGRYRVCWRNPKSRFHLFLGLSYPGPDDARLAYRRGEIDLRVLRDVERAAEIWPVSCPPWKTPLGGFIGIHGHGSFADWTAGCIAVNNDVIEELWLLVPVGTPVEIRP